MVHLNQLEEHLKHIGHSFRFFNRPEVKELAKILMPNEKVAQCVNGYYEGGFALLVVTDHRLLLIDRKPMFLTIEDIRFDMIAEVDFNHRLLNATARVYSTNKSLVFTSWNHSGLRTVLDYLQQRVIEMRHQNPATMQAQFSSVPQQPQIPAETLSQPAAMATQQIQQSQPQQSTYIVPSLAQVAMGSNAGASIPAQQLSLPTISNPYTKIPLLTRRRKFPSFF